MMACGYTRVHPWAMATPQSCAAYEDRAYTQINCIISLICIKVRHKESSLCARGVPRWG